MSKKSNITLNIIYYFIKITCVSDNSRGYGCGCLTCHFHSVILCQSVSILEETGESQRNL